MRLKEPTHPAVVAPAAGIPWFLTLFGRDSLIVGMDSIAGFPELAAGALRQLSELQATRQAAGAIPALQRAVLVGGRGDYFFGLNGKKEPIRTVASNAGHVLHSGIVAADRAGRVVARPARHIRKLRQQRRLNRSVRGGVALDVRFMISVTAASP